MVTSIISLTTGLMVLVTGLIGLLKSRETKQTMQEIHVLVNSRLSQSIERTDQLIALLKDKGIDVPEERKQENAI